MSLYSDLAVAGYSPAQIEAAYNFVHDVVSRPEDLVAAGFSTAQALAILYDRNANGFTQQGLWFGTQAPALADYLND